MPFSILRVFAVNFRFPEAGFDAVAALIQSGVRPPHSKDSAQTAMRSLRLCARHKLAGKRLRLNL